jgi:hypothetical protein
MSPSNWGPPTWDFIHTICAKLKPESFSIVGPSLISYLMKNLKLVEPIEIKIHLEPWLIMQLLQV